MKKELLSRDCPSCGDVIEYETSQGFKNACKNDSYCVMCRSIFRAENVIEKLTVENKYDFSSGQMIRYIYSFPEKSRKDLALKILNLCNPDIIYEINGRLSRRESNVVWKCKHHFDEIYTTSFRHVVERKQGCRQCKGQNPSGYWKDTAFLKSKMLELITKVYNDTGCIFSLTNYFNWDSKTVNAWYKYIPNPSETFYFFAREHNFPDPTLNAYIKDGKIFRGFYEFVGYCLIKNWGVPLDYSPKVFGKYYSDGYFSELNTHWEHWGGLNKNNSKKLKLYSRSKFELFETFDYECRNKGLSFFCASLRDFLTKNGYKIPAMEHSDILAVIKGNVANFDIVIKEVLQIIKSNGWESKIVESTLRDSKEGFFILSLINKYFDGSILKFKTYLNENYEFNYTVKAFRGSYKDAEYFKKQLKPFLEEFGYIPTQKFFESVNRSDITNMASRLCNGLNNLKRNQVEEGNHFHLVKDLYPNNSAPYDKKLEWDGDKNYNTNVLKVIEYFKSNNILFPQTMNDLRCSDSYQPFGPTIHSAISRKGGWDLFCSTYKSLW